MADVTFLAAKNAPSTIPEIKCVLEENGAHISAPHLCVHLGERKVSIIVIVPNVV